ncbi:MAG: AAA family ATPase [Fimbriimonadales bacterium]
MSAHDSVWFFHLLGGFEARLGAFRITRFRTAKDLSLLGYLIVHPPHRFARATLARVLWEDSPPYRARNNLSVSLNALRRAFENAGERDLIEADARQIGLNPNRFRADVLEFEQALQHARACSDPETQYEHYAQAVGSYRGEFLPMVYDLWAVSVAATLQAERQCALDRLVQIATARGDTAQAQAWHALSSSHDWSKEAPSIDATPDEPPQSLPALRCRLVGRETERARLINLLAEPCCVTIFGLSGFGKTSLALAAAHQLHGQGETVHWIALTAIGDARQLVAHIAQSLNLPATEPMETLQRYCAQYCPVLFLDNIDHLLPDGAAAIAELLRAVPAARLCLTSRLPLRIEAETPFPLAALACTDAHENPAMTLFVERACQQDACFRLTEANRAQIRELCERLDGIPLALELAAARLRTLSPRKMLAHIDRRLEWLQARRQDIEPRHRTMQGVLDTAVGALPRTVQRAFAQLSLLPDVWRLDEAETATNLSRESIVRILNALCEASLVERVGESPPRYRMLEIVREHGQAQLSAARRRSAENRLCAYTLRTAIAHASDAYSPQLAAWLAFWDERRPTLLMTLDLLEGRGEWRSAVRLLCATERYFYLRPLVDDAIRRLNRWLERGALPPSETVEARLLLLRLLFETQQFAAATPIAQSLAQLDRRDRRRDWALYWNTHIAFLRRDAPTVQRYWRLLRRRAARSPDPRLNQAVHYLRGYLDGLEDPVAWREAGMNFARATGDPLLLQHALDALAEQRMFFGEYAHALQSLDEAEQVCAALDDWLHWNRIQHARAQCYLQLGELTPAQQLLDACAAQERQRGQSLHTTHWLQGQLLRWQGDPAAAIVLVQASVADLEARQYWHSAAMMLELAALCARDLDQLDDALRYCGQASRLRAHEDDVIRTHFNRTLRAYLLALSGDAHAPADLEACLQFWSDRRWRAWQANTLQYLGEAYARHGDAARARDALQTAIALNEAMGRALALQKCRNLLRD